MAWPFREEPDVVQAGRDNGIMALLAARAAGKRGGIAVDPATMGAVLAAVAGGVLGSQVWEGITALVRRSFHHSAAMRAGSAVAELAALRQAHE